MNVDGVTASVTSPKACTDGYVLNQNGISQCVAACPSGYYGSAVLTSSATVQTSYCLPCATGCYECANGTSSTCKSCNKNYYLDLAGNYNTTIGTCLVKSVTPYLYTIYVASFSVYQNKKTQASTSGTLTNPFNYLTDAIAKAQEVCAPYAKCTVTIRLIGTSHGMINNLIDFYMPTKIDQYSQSMSLIIQPNTTNQATTTIYYKMKDMWTFKIGGGLTIYNITFDAIDSVIDPS